MYNNYNDNNVSCECFTFTADHEEPCCTWCDRQDTCDGRRVKCGPKFGWAAYSRTVQIGDMTENELELINIIKRNK